MEAQTEFIRTVGNDERAITKAAEFFPQLTTIKSQLYESRVEKYPLLPRTIDDWLIEDEWALTETASRRFLLHHTKDEESSMVIFCSDIGLKILSLSKRWHSDGTFETAPIMFAQLYVIHSKCLRTPLS